MLRTEQRIQTSIASWLNRWLPSPWYFSAIGHGPSYLLRGQILRGMGVKRGVWDLMLLGPECFIGWLEVKTPKGRLSPDQEVFGERVRFMGHHTAIVRSVDDVRATLALWHVPTRDRQGLVTETLRKELGRVA